MNFQWAASVAAGVGVEVERCSCCSGCNCCFAKHSLTYSSRRSLTCSLNQCHYSSSSLVPVNWNSNPLGASDSTNSSCFGFARWGPSEASWTIPMHASDEQFPGLDRRSDTNDPCIYGNAIRSPGMKSNAPPDMNCLDNLPCAAKVVSYRNSAV